jgi:hypothetical protein
VDRKKIPHGTKLPVVLTLKDRDIVRDETFCDPNFGRVGVVEGNKIKLMMSLDDIEDVQGHVAAEATHTKDKKLRKELDRIFDKFQKFLDKYDDQEEIE